MKKRKKRHSTPERRRERRDPKRIVDRWDKSQAERGKYYKIGSGTTTLRILPPFDPNSDDVGVKQLLHFGFKLESGRQKSIPCLEYHSGHPCPVCKVVDWLYAHQEDSGKYLEYAKKMGIQKSYLVNAQVKDLGKKGRKKVKIVNLRPSAMEQINRIIAKPGYGDITDELRGWDIWLERTGSGFDTRYHVDVDPESRGPIDIPKWDEKLHNLEGEIKKVMLTEEEAIQLISENYTDLPLKRIFSHVKGDTPKRRVKKRRRRRG